MRGLLWAVAIIVLAVALDASFYGGRHTEAVSRLFSDMATHMR
jgi:hypothetical protein